MKSVSWLFMLALATLIFSCQNKPEKTENTEAESHTTEAPVAVTGDQDTFYQYSIWFAFVNKVFDGSLTVKELKTHGNVGLGSFDFLDGELVMLDGVPYRIRENGEISVGQDHDEIVYADAAFFDKEEGFTIEETIKFSDLASKLDAKKKSPHYFYIYKVHGTFKYIKLGGVPKVARPFTDGLDVLIPNRPVFETENIAGTLVGFYCPDYIGNINAKGHHFHFISDDKKWGGHVMDFESSGPLEVQSDAKTKYQFDLPVSTEFENVDLSKEFQYN
ncbi:acetolactate decarboxylase [Seonamhaeicola sp.]|uniref:acetolactate decarboxylase n=1 Tax=Seonamhaeicola sp. TaxID=1912245 RepID=UPI002616DAB9|nr:acetolactate decarboxylase [Seonamhaeicola sp.]